MRRAQVTLRRRQLGATVVLTMVLLLVRFAAPTAEAQHQQVPRIGVLSMFAAPDQRVETLKEGLRDLGWVENQNVELEYRYAHGEIQRAKDLAADLARRKVNVIVAWGEVGIRAARTATRTIPIVMGNSGDPVGTGLIASLARPGGNITGSSLVLPELGGKRLALLREAVPTISHVAVLWNPTNAAKPLEWKSTEAAAEVLGVQVTSVTVREPSEFVSAFAAISRARPDALMVFAEPLTVNHRHQIGEFAVSNRLPMIAELREFAEAGGLMTYGPSLLALSRRAATYVDKILKGAKPADLPVEQPNKFEMVINLKTAKALGLTIPESVLIRADEVIH